MLTGFLLLTQWAMPELGAGAATIGYNVMTGQDWYRTLGLLRAATLKLERDYLTPDEDDTEAP